MSRATPATLASEAELREIGDFVLEEADLLDGGRFGEWIELVAKDVRYRVETPLVTELGAPTRRVPLYDEDFASLSSRVQQFSRPEFTVAENPRSIDRRFVTNLRAWRGEEAGTWDVRSNVLLRRARGLGEEVQIFSYARRDRLRRAAGGGLELALRSAVVDDAVLQARSLSVLF